MGEWDSHNNPSLELSRHNLRAEFEVDFSEGAEVSGHMLYTTISTDRIQFFNIEPKPQRFQLIRRRPLRLAEVPAVVFSEVMRDIDLLVGVTSIGADPAWGMDRDVAHAEYWQRFADSELAVAAENRKSVLETLLPKLAIRDRCRLEGRYLLVRGESNEFVFIWAAATSSWNLAAAIFVSSEVPETAPRQFRCPSREALCSA